MSNKTRLFPIDGYIQRLADWCVDDAGLKSCDECKASPYDCLIRLRSMSCQPRKNLEVVSHE